MSWHVMCTKIDWALSCKSQTLKHQSLHPSIPSTYSSTGAFICQSQSLNIHMAEPTTARLTSMHFYAWKRGLKTGMYYLRTRPKGKKITNYPARPPPLPSPYNLSECNFSHTFNTPSTATHHITADAIQFTVDQTALAKTKQADIDAKAGTPLRTTHCTVRAVCQHLVLSGQHPSSQLIACSFNSCILTPIRSTAQTFRLRRIASHRIASHRISSYLLYFLHSQSGSIECTLGRLCICVGSSEQRELEGTRPRFRQQGH